MMCFRMRVTIERIFSRVVSLRISSMSLALAAVSGLAAFCIIMSAGAELRLTQAEASYNELSRIALERELQIRDLLGMLGEE